MKVWFIFGSRSRLCEAALSYEASFGFSSAQGVAFVY